MYKTFPAVEADVSGVKQQIARVDGAPEAAAHGAGGGGVRVFLGLGLTQRKTLGAEQEACRRTHWGGERRVPRGGDGRQGPALAWFAAAGSNLGLLGCTCRVRICGLSLPLESAVPFVTNVGPKKKMKELHSVVVGRR